MVDNAWKAEVFGSAFTILYKKQAATMDALRKWNKEVFGKCQDKINQLMSKIVNIQSRECSEENGRIEAFPQVELFEWLVRSIILWR